MPNPEITYGNLDSDPLQRMLAQHERKRADEEYILSRGRGGLLERFAYRILSRRSPYNTDESHACVQTEEECYENYMNHLHEEALSRMFGRNTDTNRACGYAKRILQAAGAGRQTKKIGIPLREVDVIEKHGEIYISDDIRHMKSDDIRVMNTRGFPKNKHVRMVWFNAQDVSRMLDSLQTYGRKDRIHGVFDITRRDFLEEDFPNHCFVKSSGNEFVLVYE